MSEVIGTVSCTLRACVFRDHFPADFKDGTGLQLCLLCKHSEEN